MTIQKLERQHYSRLIQIWESAVRATHHFLSVEDFEFYKSRLPDYFGHVALYGYMDEDKLIKGFLGVSEDMIEMLFIDDQYRGQGIGKSLLLYAIKDLRLDKVDVNEQNVQALGFYKHYGFQLFGRSERDTEGMFYPIIHLKIVK